MYLGTKILRMGMQLQFRLKLQLRMGMPRQAIFYTAKLRVRAGMDHNVFDDGCITFFNMAEIRCR